MDVQRLANRLTQQEGSRLQVYDDATGAPIVKGSVVEGNPTIGIGHNLASPGITAQEQSILLEDDINAAADLLNVVMPWWATLDNARQDALCNMCFNMGIAELQTFDTFLDMLKAGQYAAAAQDLKFTLWSRQVGARAVAIEAQIRTGLFADGTS